jgi:hypothetical protein
LPAPSTIVRPFGGRQVLRHHARRQRRRHRRIEQRPQERALASGCDHVSA